MFSTVDRKAKLYQRFGGHRGASRLAAGHVPAPVRLRESASTPVDPSAPVGAKIAIREVTERALLSQFEPAAAMVTGHGDILYLHGRTGMYLEPTPGETGVNNILKMAREGLRHELTRALHAAAETRDVVRSPDLLVKTNGSFTPVRLTIRPVPETQSGLAGVILYLVILQEITSADTPGTQGPQAALRATADPAELPGIVDDTRVDVLMRELRAKEESLQAANEELESANEELKSSNEEMQSVNEELQSTNEELETSKEELQSVNEELSTVNVELNTKVFDLSRVNNDMANLLAGTGIGTVFVDHHLRIVRFTPAATRIINLIPGDVGRPVNHILSNLVGYDALIPDAQSVLDTLQPKRVEVQTVSGTWYAMNIQPYRTLDNVIEGAVFTFVDITEMKETAEGLRQANDLARLAVVVRDASDAITVHDHNGRILAWNPGAERMYGWTEAEALAMNIRNMIPQDRTEEELQMLRGLMQAQALEPYDTQRLSKDGAVHAVRMICTALVNESGEPYAIATTERMSRRPNDDSKG